MNIFAEYQKIIGDLIDALKADGSLDAASVTIASGPFHGTVTLDGATGALTYTPAANYFGADSLKYTVSDDMGASSNQATVLITVNPVNDAPVAVNDTTVTSEDTPVDIAVTANDSDVDGTLDFNTLTVVSGPSNGSTSVNTSTGETIRCQDVQSLKSTLCDPHCRGLVFTS